MNNKDKHGTYYDTVNQKKIEFVYDKGKILSQEEKPLSVSPEQKFESEYQDDFSE